MMATTSSTRVFAPAKAAQRPSRRSVKVQAYKVTFREATKGTEKTVECGADEYLLDVADANRIDMPASCRGGVCGSCVGKLVSGEIDNSWQCELDDGNVLSADQMAAGWILPCSSKPKSDLVVEYSYGWGIQVIEGWNSRDKVDANLTVPKL